MSSFGDSMIQIQRPPGGLIPTVGGCALKAPVFHATRKVAVGQDVSESAGLLANVMGIEKEACPVHNLW
jgi:hypothetical protein